ncbi:hypothetical protein Tco_1570061 [Tanacetum coccineum]
MEILLEPTSNKLMVGDLCDSIRIKLVTTGKKRWGDSIRIKLVLVTHWFTHIVLSALRCSGNEHAEFDESNTNVLERFYTSAGNPVKEILLKLNLPDHRILKDGGKVKEPQERCFIKAFQDNVSRKVFKITISHSRQDKEIRSSLKSMITTSHHKLMIEVKEYELKTKVEA